MVALTAVSVGVTGAFGQVRPTKLYHGVDRPLLVEVTSRGGQKSELAIFRAGEKEPFQRQTVSRGKVDVAKLFGLWKEKSTATLYLQSFVGGKPTGPAVVLQPLLNPVLSRLNPDGKAVDFVPDEDGPLFNGFRTYQDSWLLFETSLGNMTFRLRPDAAPNTAFTLLQLAQGGLYDDVIFHRVVAKRADGSPFVIQGGDPTGTGSGGPGFSYALEKSTLPHDFGVISIARSTDPNTNGSQFFVCLSREGTKHLDERYAAFGECIAGEETILKIAAVPVGPADRPKEPPVVRRVRVVPAAPYGTGPAPVKRPA